MDTYEIKSIVIPVMVALDLTILGILLGVVLGFAWELDVSHFTAEIASELPSHRPTSADHMTVPP